MSDQTDPGLPPDESTAGADTGNQPDQRTYGEATEDAANVTEEQRQSKEYAEDIGAKPDTPTP